MPLLDKREFFQSTCHFKKSGSDWIIGGTSRSLKIDQIIDSFVDKGETFIIIKNLTT